MKATFHLALPCESIIDVRAFYTQVLGAKEGRSADNWIDIDLFGNQLTFSKTGAFKFDFKNYKLGERVLPSFHFGVVVDPDSWQKLHNKLSKENIDVTTEVSFLKNKVGEHVSFFLTDPNGYVVEFKSFKDQKEIFQAH